MNSESNEPIKSEQNRNKSHALDLFLLPPHCCFRHVITPCQMDLDFHNDDDGVDMNEIFSLSNDATCALFS